MMDWTHIGPGLYGGSSTLGSDRWLLERMGGDDWMLWYSGCAAPDRGLCGGGYPVSRLVTPDGAPLRRLAELAEWLQTRYLDQDGSSCYGDIAWVGCRKGLVDLCRRYSGDTKRGGTRVVDTLRGEIERARCPLQAVEVDF